MNGPLAVISLDFELRWGLFDVLGEDLGRYRANIEGVREVVPRLLELFSARSVPATWAVVGAVTCKGWDEWEARVPPAPPYGAANLHWRASFRRLDAPGRLHFAPDLVERILAHPAQELASHTFSHVYFREAGFQETDATADADAMVRLFHEKWGRTPESIVFPRNQVGYIAPLRERGIVTWRDTPRPRFWRSTTAAEESRSMRALRLADSLLPFGSRTYPARQQRASYFVRFNLPEPLWRLHSARIANDASNARPGDVLHLWWHPHNLGDAPAAKTKRAGELLDRLAERAPGLRFCTMRAAA